MDYGEIIKKLKSSANPDNVKGMAKFGINPKNTLGISIPTIRNLAKKIGKNHKLALRLWKSGIHEARMLAGFIDDPGQVTNRQMAECGLGISIPGMSVTRYAVIYSIRPNLPTRKQPPGAKGTMNL